MASSLSQQGIALLGACSVTQGSSPLLSHFTSDTHKNNFFGQCPSPAFSLSLSNSSHEPCHTGPCLGWELTVLALAHLGDINWSFTLNQCKEEV